MPIYEYQCSFCNHQLETMQKITEQPLKDCPACHQPGLTKLISAAGFQLKGTGWYVTDYSAKGKAKAAASKSAETTTTETQSGETKTTDKGSSSNTEG